jgi:hypothetical protein
MSNGFSFPVGFPLVFYPLLGLGAGTSRHPMFFGGIALVLALVFTWEAFSRKEYEAICAKDPTMNLPTWRFNWLAFFAAPGYAVALLGWW